MTNKTKLSLTYLGILLLMILLFGVYLKHESKLELEKLNKSKILWNISANNEQLGIHDLQSFSLKKVNKNDKITLTTTLPQTAIQNPILKIYAIYSCLDAYSDNKLIYSYGHDLFALNKIVGCGYHFIDLNLLSEKKDITLVFTVTEPEAFSSIKDVEIISNKDSLTSIIKSNLFIFTSDVFLIFLGCLGILIATFFLNQKEKIYPVFSILAFSLFIGLGSLCNNNFIQIFSDNFTINSYLEYAALYGSTLSLTVIFYYLFALNKKEKFFVKQYGIFFSLYIIVAIILQITNIAHLQNSLNICQILMAIGLASAFYIAIKNIIKNKSIKQNFLSIGVLILVILCGFDLLRYVIFKYIFTSSITMKTTLMSLGTIVFIITSLVQYFYIELNLSLFKESSYSNNIQHNILYPGIYTNEAFNEILKKQDKYKTSEYSLITFNLRFSKNILLNQNVRERDKVKSNFAKTLYLVFSQYGQIAKTNDSQFSIIAPFIPTIKLKQLLSTFNVLINQEIVSKNNDNFAFSYGYAFSYENNENNFQYLLNLSRVRANLTKLN